MRKIRIAAFDLFLQLFGHIGAAVTVETFTFDNRRIYIFPAEDVPERILDDWNQRA